jgi:branched-chain amino acid transport system substrate-binding protein
VRRLAGALAVAVVVAGCGSSAGITDGGTIIGRTVTVYSLLPAPGVAGPARDVRDGEKLALAQAGGRAGAYSVNYVSLDERSPAGAAAAARQAISDPQVVAVIGSLESAEALVSIPLLNAAGILQVSPGAGDPGLTVGDDHYPAGYRSFARVVGDDRDQAAALIRAAGDGPVYLEAEATPAGRRLAAAVRAAGSGVRFTTSARSARTVIYAGQDVATAAGVLRALAREAPRARLLVPDALVRAGLATRARGGAFARVDVVSAAPAPDATPALRRFAAEFRARFGREPGPYAAVGYEAMRGVLSAVTRAGAGASRRRTVIDTYFASGERGSLLGPLRTRRDGSIAAPRYSTWPLRDASA